MRFNTDKIEWTESMKDFAESIIEKKLNRLSTSITDSEIKLTKLNGDTLKVTLCIDGLRAQAVNADFYAAMVDAASKIKSIAAKQKKVHPKYEQLSIEDLGIEFEDSKLPFCISKEKVFALTPISIDDAIGCFEKTDYPFYVFKDVDDNDTVAIIYKRYNDTYGLIRCH